MQPELPTLEYAEGEIFRPHPAMLTLMFVFFALAIVIVLVLNVQFFLVPATSGPVVLLLLAEAVYLFLFVELSYFIFCMLRAYIRLHNEGMEYRPFVAMRPAQWKKTQFKWAQIDAVTFARRRKALTGIKLEIAGRSKLLRIPVHLYRKNARQRIEAIVRQHVTAEKIHERKLTIWSVRF